MGKAYNYKCDNCGYSAIVSGGRDFGFVAVVKTMICEDCKNLVDVLIGRHGKDGATGDIEYDRKLNICPICAGKNLKAWPTNHTCPRCSANMIRSRNGSDVILWD